LNDPEFTSLSAAFEDNVNQKLDLKGVEYVL